MHGRTLLKLIAAALAASLVVAGTAAAADAPPACPVQSTCLALGQPAPYDAVVTAVRLQAATDVANAHVRVVQPLAGGGTRIVDDSAVFKLPAGRTVDVDMADAFRPIGTTALGPGNRVEVVAGGASVVGSLTIVADPDGDGEPCRPLSFQVACERRFGSPLALAPDPDGFSASGHPMDVVQASAPGTRQAAPIDGVITYWYVRSATTDPLTLQILRPGAGGTLTDVAESGPQAPTADTADGRRTPDAFQTRIPVKAGDRLGLKSPGDMGAVAAAVPGADRGTVQLLSPPLALGGAAAPDATTYGFRLLVAALVEPDADGDGYGDDSQDACPFDAARRAGCAADLAVSTSTPDATVPYGQETGVDFTVTNTGPDPAIHVHLAMQLPDGFRPGDDAQGCRLQVNAIPPNGLDCYVASLAPGASVTRHLVGRAPSGTSLAIGAGAYSATLDDNFSNDGATARRFFALPYVPNLPPQPPMASPPCSHVERGTRDDDVLRGTVFGDRLVGSDGGDLLKGGPGDDCLEGGAGADVLDGGDGNDRLNGSSGKDRLAGGTGNDRLTGGRGNDRLSGGPGNDTISPGDGHDVVDAGGGNDTINSVDGVRETIDCGPGRDTVRADRRDRLKHCEKVTRRR